MVDLRTMTEAEILEFAQNLSQEDFDNLDEASQEIIEAATAIDTLNPGAGSGGTESKAQMLATFAALAAQLGKEDLSDLYNRTIATIGQEAANIPNDAAAKNAATVAMKGAVVAEGSEELDKALPGSYSRDVTMTSPRVSSSIGRGAGWRPKETEPAPVINRRKYNPGSMKRAMTEELIKEDIDDMFSSDGLSEEFKEKASTVFEAAVNVRAILKEAELQEIFEETVSALEEEFEEKLQEEAAKVFDDLSEKLDQYLDYAIKEWLEENQLAVENSLRAEIAEDFIQGLHGLFAEHYIRVPDEQLDLVAEMKSELEEVKSKLNETVDSKLELQAIIDEATREAALDEMSEGLSAIQSEKLRTLAEGIEFTDVRTYGRKLSILKENISNKKAAKSTGFITEEIDGSVDGEDRTAAVPAHMQHYMKAIAKSVKN